MMTPERLEQIRNADAFYKGIDAKVSGSVLDRRDLLRDRDELAALVRKLEAVLGAYQRANRIESDGPAALYEQAEPVLAEARAFVAKEAVR